MRFLALHAIRFGPLLDRRFELDAGVFVVFGPNEAGKSSFHAALQSILYGFERASRSEHPLAQFGELDSDLEIAAIVQLDDDRRWQVRRTLMSYGKVQVVELPDREVLNSNRNDVLPAIQSIPKQLFEAVYSLTANDTSMQTDGVRDHIQELLLGETGLRGARPISEVRRTLTEDMQTLWRPDNLGKPAAKRIHQGLRDATALQRSAKQRDRELREAYEEREGLRPRLEELKGQRKELRRGLERLLYGKKWREFHVRAHALATIEARLHELPPEVLQAGVENPAQLEQALRRVQEFKSPLEARLLATRQHASERELRWVQHAETMETLLEALLERRDLQRDANHLESDLARHKASLSAALAGLGLTAAAGRWLPKVPVVQLQNDALQWERDLQDYRQAFEQKQPSSWWLLCAGLGVGAAVVAAFFPAWLFVSLGVCLVCFALAIGLLRKPSRDPDLGPEPGLPITAAHALQPLGLPPSSVRSPGVLSQQVAELRRTQEDWRRAREVAQELDAVRTSLVEREQALLAWAAPLGLEGAIDAWSSGLKELWSQARASVAASQLDERERLQAQNTLNHWQTETTELQTRIERTRTLLRTAFPDCFDPEEAFQAWQAYGTRKLAAAQDLERLRADALYEASWEQPAEESANETARETSAEELTIALDELEHALQTLHTRLGALNEKLTTDTTAHLARASEVVQALRNELQETLEERDRLALLACVLDKAESEYRKAHQPDVLLRAGDYLANITAGRYTALRYPDARPEEGRSPVLQVLSSQQGWRDVAKPLSRGTQEQIYLALRLGTLDYLDQGRERLPLVLDEALVHWDRPRREALYRVLNELCQHRQVILFTCHEAFAEEVQVAMDARLIALQN